MRYVHITTRPDGESHVEVAELDTPTTEFLPGVPPFGVSAPFQLGPGTVVQTPSDILNKSAEEQEALLGYHAASAPQLVVCLSGSFTVKASDGSSEHVAAGGVVLAEDVGARGHLTLPSGSDQYWFIAPVIGTDSTTGASQ